MDYLELTTNIITDLTLFGGLKLIKILNLDKQLNDDSVFTNEIIYVICNLGNSRVKYNDIYLYDLNMTYKLCDLYAQKIIDRHDIIRRKLLLFAIFHTSHYHLNLENLPKIDLKANPIVFTYVNCKFIVEPANYDYIYM